MPRKYGQYDEVYIVFDSLGANSILLRIGPETAALAGALASFGGLKASHCLAFVHHVCDSTGSLAGKGKL